jgi:enoyl-CoA hydratase
LDLKFLTLEVADHIAVVTLNNPPVHAQPRGMREELIRVFDALSDREDVRVVVLTATGKVFSAGADVKERRGLAQEPGDYWKHNRLTREFFFAVSDCRKPVIAAANGPAIGAGFALMMSSDIMIAAEDAWVQMPELDVGLAGGSKLLTEHFGRSMARHLYFTARRIPASELYRLGVISACVPRERLMEEAMTIAREIAQKSPVAVRAVKRAFNAVEEMPYRDAYRFEQSITEELSHSEDTKEAQAAFVEKRKPVFKGR